MHTWGIDLGGTKIECAVLNAANNHDVLARKRIATEAHKGYEHIVQQVALLVETVANDIGESPTQIGFATPGALEPSTQLMKNCNTVCMNGKPMHNDLQQAVGVPVKLANDANCFALAETLMGAGKHYPDAELVFGIIMGTGVGGGVVAHGKVINGLHGIAGEWGHNILEENGDPCYCGKRGCVEKVLSGPALEAYYQKTGGYALRLPEIVARYLAGDDAHAATTIQRLLHYYGRAVSTLINVLDPKLIIIGGGVGNIDLLYTEGYEQIKNFVFNEHRLNTPIVKPVLGDSAGVFGAALL